MKKIIMLIVISFFTVNVFANQPPGLSKKDTLPPGLEKQNKTPSGWSKGKKGGWAKTESNNENSDSSPETVQS